MKKLANYCPLILLFLFATPKVNAQSVDVVIRDNGKERQESIELPKSMTYPLDSLLNDWKAKNYIDLGKDCSTAEINPLFSDSVYIDRLSRMPTVMEMPYNEIVRKFIDMYAGRLRNQVSFMLSACNFYMPIFEEALDAYNLPLELKYLPIIESALNPSAVSRAGAGGLWQFMIGTGKMYGLESNSLVDDRRDPIKATWAAARYLKDLYDIYHDWNLVIAAYNCGPGTINKAIRRSGGETDYWSIYNYLPKETRGYVPAFIAANYVMTYYCDHNICPMETNIPESTDTIQVNKNLHFQQIADLCNVPMDQIRSLNPQYKKKSYRVKASRTHCAFHKTRSVRSSTVRIRFMPTVPANCSRIGVQWPSGTTVQPPRGEVALPKPAVVHPLTIKSKTGIPWEPLRQNMVYA